jgi:hypothetical protein
LGGVNSYDRALDKSIGAYNIPNDFKLSGVYDLPIGKGKRWLAHGVGAVVLGNWRVSAVTTYESGLPVHISTTYSLPIFAGQTAAYVTSYSGWQPSWSGSFDPSVDNFLVPYGTGPFPKQGAGTPYNGIGNVTRYNPDVHFFPLYNENFSLAKSFPIHEQLRLDIRAEAFNALNRVQFGTSTSDVTLQDANFGKFTSNSDIANVPRQLQLALKLYF